MKDKPLIQIPNMCKMHQSLLVNQCNFTKNDPWRSLIIMAQVSLFQAATVDDNFYQEIDGDLLKTEKIGCLACFKPNIFDEIVNVVQTKGQGAIKELGESYLKPKS